MAKANPEAQVIASVGDIVKAEQEIALIQDQLDVMEGVREMMERQKTLQSNITLFWKSVEEQMLKNNIKSVKGDFGSITIAEKLQWETTEELPAKFFKKTVDTKKLSDTYRLTGKVPKGAAPKTLKYITKRLKGNK